MKDRLLFLTIGLLVGIVLVQVGVGDNRLDVSDVMASGVFPGTGVVAIYANYLLDQNGEGWQLQTHNPQGNLEPKWYRNTSLDVPVPADQIKLWSTGAFVTIDNIGWAKDGNVFPNVWYNCGPWPGGSVSADQNTWGKIKETFKGENK